MFHRTRNALVAVTVGLGLTAALTGPAVAHQEHHHQRTEVTRGHFVTLPGGEALGYRIRGYAVMVRHADRTTVRVHVRGLDANTTYPAHVHNAPCSATPPGGSHYQQLTPGPADALNEIWPTVITDRHGKGRGYASHGFRARADAMSIVIHYPPTTSIRLACLDLA